MKKTPRKAAKKSNRKPAAPKKKPRLLSGGNPQIAKGDGEAPVRAYLDALPGWKQKTGKALDALIMKHAPKAVKAVKWNSPFYGMPGQGWFVSFHAFDRFLKVTFFKGTSLKPPPAGGKSQEARWIDVHEGEDLGKTPLAGWIKQASKIPGWLA